MEKMKELVNNAGEAYCTVFYHATTNAVVDVWTGNFGSQDNFKAGIMAVHDVIVAKKCTAWVADITQMKGSFDSSGEWLTKVAVPKAQALGVVKQALALPQNIFSKLSASENAAKVDSYEIRQFASLGDALAWAGQAQGKVA